MDIRKKNEIKEREEKIDRNDIAIYCVRNK